MSNTIKPKPSTTASLNPVLWVESAGHHHPRSPGCIHHPGNGSRLCTCVQRMGPQEAPRRYCAGDRWAGPMASACHLARRSSRGSAGVSRPISSRHDGPRGPGTMASPGHRLGRAYPSYSPWARARSKFARPGGAVDPTGRRYANARGIAPQSRGPSHPSSTALRIDAAARGGAPGRIRPAGRPGRPWARTAGGIAQAVRPSGRALHVHVLLARGGDQMKGVDVPCGRPWRRPVHMTVREQ